MTRKTNSCLDTNFAKDKIAQKDMFMLLNKSFYHTSLAQIRKNTFAFLTLFQ